MIDERVATALQNIDPALVPQTTVEVEQDNGQTMSVDNSANPSTSALVSANLEGTGLTLSQFGSIFFSAGAEGISSASTARRAGNEQPSISFTFGSGIATPEPSISIIDSNLPFADTPAGPIFRAADTSLAVPSPAMDVISTPSIIEATQDGDQEPEHEGSTN